LEKGKINITNEKEKGSNSAKFTIPHTNNWKEIGNNATVAKGKNLNYHVYYTICMKGLMVMVKS
jgi:hypothetical protein